VPVLRPERIDEIVRALRAGEVVAIPTDTVYGLAAMPDDAAAVRALAALKGRSEQQPIAVLFDDIETVASHVEDAQALRRLARFWPGALTAVVRVRAGLATAALTPAGTLGVRQPDDELARAVIRACGGALAVSSANRTGEPPALSAIEVVAAFGEAVPVLDGGARAGGTASTVVDVSVEPPAVLREGPIAAAEVLAALRVGGGEPS
jgi:tRNA threonylcarbamoyl adenosine modification protein (Sua5/YciO/YrdC/YwlC family)